MNRVLLELVREEERVEKADAREISGAQTVQRAFSVLRLLASNVPSSMKLVEIVRHVDLNRTTVHRLLRALEQEGVVERTQNPRGYTVGPELGWLGLGASGRMPVRTAAAPVLDMLSEAVGDAVFLTVKSGLDSICADRRIGSFPIQVLSIAVGSRRPLGVSQGGRAILAFLDPTEAAEIIERNRARFRVLNLSGGILASTIAEARRTGYLCSDGVTVRNTRVIGVPVLDVNNRPIAAISVIAPRHRIPSARIPRLAALLTAAAAEISDRILKLRTKPTGGIHVRV